MKSCIAFLLCSGLVSSVVNGAQIRDKTKRFILTFVNSGCSDALGDCASYPHSVCSDSKYAAWADENCKSTCNLCSSGSGGGSHSGGGSGCTDKLSDCSSYGPSSCTGQYAAWAKDNCAQTCHLCNRAATSGSFPVPSVGCIDKASDCSSYGPSACGGEYVQWAKENCAKTCNLCSPASGSSGAIPVPVPVTGNGGPVPAVSTSCSDKLSDCSSYGSSACGGQYATWAKDNCAKTCNLCSPTSGGGGGVPVPVPGNGGSVPAVSTSCSDKRSDCSSYGPSSCTGQYAQWADENCKKTCNLCGPTSGGGGGIPVPVPGNGGPVPAVSTSCIDKRSDCSSYGPSSCTGQYVQWATENCKKTCNLCGGSSSGGNTGGSPSTGGGSPSTGGGGGQSSGCYYNSQLYQEGEEWRDACKYNCRCTDGTAGKYECRSLCLSWNLPPTCHMNPPAAGKCCPKPSCPSNILLQYPPDYVDV